MRMIVVVDTHTIAGFTTLDIWKRKQYISFLNFGTCDYLDCERLDCYSSYCSIAILSGNERERWVHLSKRLLGKMQQLFIIFELGGTVRDVRYCLCVFCRGSICNRKSINKIRQARAIACIHCLNKIIAEWPSEGFVAATKKNHF